MSISCIAIDDDPLAIESLMSYVERLPALEMIQTFTEPVRALKEISGVDKVDIIFMDIEMPSLSGIELAGLLRKRTEHLIFTTAHPKYAIDAFGVQADAYLLKPYSILHFVKTINNLYPMGNQPSEALHESQNQVIYIPLSSEEGELARIDLQELIAVEEKDDQVEFKTLAQNYSSSRYHFLKILKAIRNNPAFITLNPSVIIAKKHIKSVLDHQVLLSGEISYAVSHSHQKAFELFLRSNAEQNHESEEDDAPLA